MLQDEKSELAKFFQTMTCPLICKKWQTPELMGTIFALKLANILECKFRVVHADTQDVFIGNKEDTLLLGFIQKLQHYTSLEFRFQSDDYVAVRLEDQLEEKSLHIAKVIQIDSKTDEVQLQYLRKDGLEDRRYKWPAKKDFIYSQFYLYNTQHQFTFFEAHHEREIRGWEEDQITFVETRATHHILGSLPLHNCIVVTGSSGCGKSANIHHAALYLRNRFEYEIIPVLTGPTAITNYHNEKKKQAFVVDDICGKETTNTHKVQMWRDYSEIMENIFQTNVTKKKMVQKKKMARFQNCHVQNY
ncbi:unnamed protein product [Mytilus edulis]|uniref:Novel STAND NTPase 3 domain-containing protein n=1 Tax=Mytilus edulis TaxID=6550 RepID=A0A8S3STQ9_MYTED|nr:unnamed protein product [Mytilus edulis]